jgi:hypothetical protein
MVPEEHPNCIGYKTFSAIPLLRLAFNTEPDADDQCHPASG